VQKSLTSALQELLTFRVRGHRNSVEIVQKGLFVLEHKDGIRKLGDELWDFLEQLATAAIDIGQLDLAKDCIARLDEHFPNSPRVEILRGLCIETKDLNLAYKYYAELLHIDESNAAAWKRQIVILRDQNKLDKAVEELSSYLDTFYSDLDGWLELADLYASIHQYSHSLQALSHTMLIAPQNPFHALRFAETAYTAGDIPLALSYFLKVVEMSEDDSGVIVRGWFGVKLCTRHLLSSPAKSPESEAKIPSTKNLQLLDQLATERLSKLYAGSTVPGRQVTLKWLARS